MKKLSETQRKVLNALNDEGGRFCYIEYISDACGGTGLSARKTLRVLETGGLVEKDTKGPNWRLTAYGREIYRQLSV